MSRKQHCSRAILIDWLPKMSKHQLLSEDQQTTLLSNLHVEWAIIAGTSLVRVVKTTDFSKALDYANKIGKIADKLNHHPELKISWGKVEVQITTHEAGGLSKADFEFAEQVDRLD